MTIENPKPKIEATIAILGAGAWGTALANLAAANGHRVRLRSRESSESLAEVIAGADIILSAVSMKGVRPVVELLKPLPLSCHTIIVTATKGLDPSTTCTPAQIWQAAFPSHPVVVLAGPNLSKEIEQGLPAATVVASTDAEAAKVVQARLNSTRFRPRKLAERYRSLMSCGECQEDVRASSVHAIRDCDAPGWRRQKSPACVQAARWKTRSA